jgi:hypothetical protein
VRFTVLLVNVQKSFHRSQCGGRHPPVHHAFATRTNRGKATSRGVNVGEVCHAACRVLWVSAPKAIKLIEATRVLSGFSLFGQKAKKFYARDEGGARIINRL